MQDTLELDWSDVEVFLAVARAGTLSGAAGQLGVNSSTIHRRVASLESSLDSILFERDPRGYSLTSVGEALVPKAEEVEEAMLALRRTAFGHDRTAQGPVTLTLPETLVEVVAPCLAQVRRSCPGLRPVLRADDRPLDLGVDADVALRPSSDPPPAAVGRKVGSIGWAVYGPKAKKRDVPWVVYTERSGPRRAAAWRRKQHPDPVVALEVTTVGAMHRVLRQGGAVGLLPAYLGDPDTALRRHSPLVADVETDLWLLIHADLRRSARVRALVDLLVPELVGRASLLSGHSK